MGKAINWQNIAHDQINLFNLEDVTFPQVDISKELVSDSLTI